MGEFDTRAEIDYSEQTPQLPDKETPQTDINALEERLVKEREAMPGQNLSPWIREMNPNRPIKELTGNHKRDIVIIGAGASGTLTAYEILKRNLDRRVDLIEADLLAHGATGANAGQIIPISELSFFEQCFGIDPDEYDGEEIENREEKIALATAAQHDALEGFKMYEQILTETGIDMPYQKTIGYGGMTQLEEAMKDLKDLHLQREAGISFRKLFFTSKEGIDPKFDGLYEVISPEELKAYLKTERDDFVAAMVTPVNIINSALLCEKLVEYMYREYPDRFVLYENSPITKVQMHENGTTIETKKYKFPANEVIFCTNGYKTVELMDYNYINDIKQYVGFMAATIDAPQAQGQAAAISHHGESEDYSYGTERRYEVDGQPVYLTVRGGPGQDIPPSEDEVDEIFGEEGYTPAEQVPTSALIRLRQELTESIGSQNPNKPLPFVWTGLMAYSSKRLPDIGFDPENPHLGFNSICGGIRLATIPFGAQKIARILAGEKFPPSLYDPHDPESEDEEETDEDN